MDISVDIDLSEAARELALPEPSVRQTVALLDDGNTVPFITRFRKEQTGALDEEPIRRIQNTVARLRALADRKRTILKSIHAQGKLSAELAEQIRSAKSTKHLEDLYLPYKPKKQTRATLARRRGLEPVAQRVLNEGLDESTLRAQLESLQDPATGLNSVDDVLAGIGHLIAEWYSERADIRGRLRHLMNRTGKLISRRAGPTTTPSQASDRNTPPASPPPESASASAPQHTEKATASPVENEPSGTDSGVAQPVDAPPVIREGPSDTTDTALESADAACVAEDPPAKHGPAANDDSGPDGTSTASRAAAPACQPDAAPKLDKPKRTGHGPLAASLQRREKKRRKLESAFKDYFSFAEKLAKIPPHRVLAINRGERARILRAKLEFDVDAMVDKACQWLVPEAHPNADLLRTWARDALCRLVLPSLEREVRREMTERAEQHAVDVFAKNLRTLLLQPPVRNHRLLAVDPGFRNGCKLVALDPFGNVLDHATIYIVGNKQRIKQGRARLVELIRQHALAVVAIGNGTACRQTEQLVSEIIAAELQDHDVSFVIVNAAGASVYSTSALGREELPKYDATLRSAISIGRRLLDPLSELVKINPANIGVGLYQHDVKAKHLQKSLDAVVESCVNYVGVDVNTASPALLRYVSGLNQLTARRLCEHRAKHGPFRTREQFKQVPGFGNATFVQAAGFLKVTDGDNPLDATWIHPECYALAEQLLQELRSLNDRAEDPERSPPAAPTDDDTPESAETTAMTPPAMHAGADWISQALTKTDLQHLSEKLAVSPSLLADLVDSLRRPGRDPREDFPAPMLRRGILKLEDLKPGMELSGTVLNVVDFGVFVDIGLPDSGLVHISRLVDRFVRDPHEVAGVGDMLRVWVTEVDKKRRRVSLTAIDPAAKPQGRRRHGNQSQRPATATRPRRTETRTPTARQPRPAKSSRPPQRKTKKPKIVTPITKEMEEGKEPLRSFSDLMQFYQKKKSDDK